ncbi:MAG: hypothetical protein CMM12_10685 [Rhodospirillaceae bacterium]|nr:hypothetical protein [Rhodospirillaceae bacterium]
MVDSMTDAPQGILIHRLGSPVDTAIMLPDFLHLSRIRLDAEKRFQTNFPSASAAAPVPMECSRLFGGHNSGPTHPAAAAQTPIVAVFSRRNPPVTRTADGESDIASIPARQIAAGFSDCLARTARTVA